MYNISFSVYDCKYLSFWLQIFDQRSISCLTFISKQSSMWKWLRVLQKARIKIVARAYLHKPVFFFLYIHCPLLQKIGCCDHCFSLQTRTQTTVQIYYGTILVSVLVSVWLTKVTHCLWYIHHVGQNLLSFSHYCFTVYFL